MRDGPYSRYACSLRKFRSSGLRWFQVAKTLGMRGEQLTCYWMSVAAAIGQFFGQILPVVAGDGVRVWFLSRFSHDWRNATISVVIDRCVGIGLLLTFTLIILLLPSSFGAFEQDRGRVAALLASIIALGLIGLLGGAAFKPGASQLAIWPLDRALFQWCSRRGVRITLRSNPRDWFRHSFIDNRRCVVAWPRTRACLVARRCRGAVCGHDRCRSGSFYRRRLGGYANSRW